MGRAERRAAERKAKRADKTGRRIVGLMDELADASMPALVKVVETYQVLLDAVAGHTAEGWSVEESIEFLPVRDRPAAREILRVARECGVADR